MYILQYPINLLITLLCIFCRSRYVFSIMGLFTVIVLVEVVIDCCRRYKFCYF